MDLEKFLWHVNLVIRKGNFAFLIVGSFGIQARYSLDQEIEKMFFYRTYTI